MQGQSFGNYEVTGLLGKGGMGEVYRARDTRLGRDVAVKVLPKEFTADATRMARFEREARLLASLNHTNISAVYGLEELDGQQCLILELAEGETLAERIDRGALPVDEAIEIARQIAEGMQAAHEKGVIHRDLKPANIKVGPDGAVKILDFGLAKAMSADDAGSDTSFPPLSMSDSPTMTHQVTVAGLLLGTAGYMSPEQAKGKPADSRTDVWAFGCVLYEMLTGGPTFKGETITDVIAAVVTRDPDWDRLPPGLPAALRRLLRRCFNKDKNLRLQHIGDARLELQDALAGGFEGESNGVHAAAPVKPEANIKHLAVAVVGALILGALGMWALNQFATEPPQAQRAFSINLEHPLKEGGLAARSFDVSRDGTMLVYTGVTGPTSQLYLRAMDDWDVRPIPGTENAGDPIFSPDGEWILYTANGQLLKVAVAGGQPILIAGMPGVPYGLDWSVGGTIILATNLSAGYYKVVEGSGLEDVAVGDDPGMFRWPEILPGDKVVLGTLMTNSAAGVRTIVAVDMHSGEIKSLMPGTSPRYLPTGHLVYKHGETGMVVPFDPERVETTGPAVALPFDVGEWIGAMWLTTSDTGDLIYKTQENRSTSELVWVDRDGRSRPAIDQRGDYFAPRVSPDGNRILWCTAVSPLGDVWVYDIQREISSRLTGEGFDAYPTWYPDGKRIVYSSDREITFQLFAKPADRIGGDERIIETNNVDIPISVAGDNTVFFYQVRGDTQRDIFAVAPDGSIVTLVNERHNERSPSVSPDGRWFAYVSDEGGRDEIYVQPYPITGQRWRVSSDGGAEPRWARDGSAIYFRNGDAVMGAQVKLRPNFSSGRPEVLFRGPYVLDSFGNPNFDVAPDGRFLMVRGEPTESADLKVVLNWFDTLKK